MDTEKKLEILADSAKYDVSCSSSGSERRREEGGIGCGHKSGICHTFTSDGRCVSLLKVLFTNYCIFDCSYCVNRRSNDRPRAAFLPRELADLTIQFYKRNYIEGLFLSSGILGCADKTMEKLIQTMEILRQEYHFGGYIHVKLIPGSSLELILRAVQLADRVSSNIELPSQTSLQLLAPDKSKSLVMQPILEVRNHAKSNGNSLIGMSTQMIVGASPESDFEILRLSSSLYNKGMLKRVYYSAYLPVNEGKNLPALDVKPPLLREHRLYQADWLLRFYGFSYQEIITEASPFLKEEFDPKMAWALRNLHLFPVEINRADREMLLRVPGFGLRSVQKILRARRFSRITFADLEKMKISLKSARYFILANGKTCEKRSLGYERLEEDLLRVKRLEKMTQPTLLDWVSSVSGEV